MDSTLPVTPPDVTIATLRNGLTIIVREDASAPVVSAQAWCRTGSIDEGKWLGAGLSHVLEHMLFKGTTTRGSGRIDQEVQDAGGYMNAYTSFDRTVYWINVPDTGATVAIDILCDIMQHATLPEDELAKEKQVILREMDMNQDDPNRRAGRRLFETAYTRSPYRFTIIGYPDIYNDLTREDVFDYYRSRYVPNNIFFVVVGKIRAPDVVSQIEKAFSGIPARSIPAVVLPDEPRQVAPREIIETAPIEMGHLHFSWHIPDVRHPDLPALDVLGSLMGSGRSSRLYQRIRQAEGIVNSIDAWTYNPGNPGLFGVSAIFAVQNFGAVQDSVLREIEALRQAPPTPAELHKVVKQFVSGTLSARKTMQGQAQDLGANWMSTQDLQFSQRYLMAVQALKPEDMQRVAQRYLTPENRTLYALLPETGSPAVRSAAQVAVEQPIQKFTLPNGLRLLVKEDHRLPFVDFRMVLRGGVLEETPAEAGRTQLLARMLMQGTATRSAEQLAVEMESLGGSIDAFGGNNSWGISAEVMTEDTAKGLELVADVLLNPSFPEEALSREKEIQLQHIQAQRDQMLQSAVRAMRRELFGNSGYGLDSLGTEESVTSLQTGHLRNVHQRQASPGNAVLAIFGDVDTARIRQMVEQQFGRWCGNPAPMLPPPTPFQGGMRRVSETRDKTQAVLVVGFPGAHIASPDRHALELLQESCSDLGSRLFLRIRDELGLAYYVGAQNFLGLAPGYFAFYVGTMPEKAAVVETELLKEAALLRQSGLTPEELQRAKAKVVGQKKIARQDLGGMATATALDELYGLGYDNYDKEVAHFEAVTQEEIIAAACKHLREDAAVIASVLPEPGPPSSP